MNILEIPISSPQEKSISYMTYKKYFSVVFIPTGPFAKAYNIKRVLAPTDTKVFCQDQFYNLKVTISSLHKEGNAKITINLINILLQLALNTAVIN